jgi:MYXO-CTERM domain-containing protein
MRKRLAVTGAALAMFASLPAAADVIGFTGPFAPASWSTIVQGDVIPPGVGITDGSVVATPSTVTITGGNDPSDTGGCISGFLSCQISFTHSTSGFSSFSFHWAYTSLDELGAQLDQFGVLLDGAKTNVSDPGAAASQSGDLVVNATNNLGWFVNCGDCTGGAAIVTLSNFVAISAPSAVSEPSSFALLGLGSLAALGALRRRRST